MEIKKFNSLKELQQALAIRPAVMLYFYQDTCGVCVQVLPKAKAIMEESFPLMELWVMEAEQHREIMAQMRMLSIPGILVFFEGQEFFRTNGLITLNEMELKIRRPYSIMFEE